MLSTLQPSRNILTLCSRIPHGFYEPQMKRYFAQFGKITKLRLSRNKKTGASKHFAFIEFKSAEVADIVAKTMHNYLMFNHILQCKVVPPAQVHPELFKGANERFSKDPRNKKAGLEMERGAERGVWEKRVAKESKRRAKTSQKLKEDFGYDFAAPTLKAVEDVPKDDEPALENGADQQLLAEAAAADVADVVTAAEVKTKKSKKGAKAKAAAAVEAPIVTEQVEEVEEIEEVQDKPAKKGRKRKSDVNETTAEEKPSTPVKAKRAKKEAAKTEDVIEEETPEETPKEKKRKAKTASDVPAKAKKSKKAKA